MKYNNSDSICFGSKDNNCLTSRKNDNLHLMELLTIEQLFEKYPQIKNEMKWSKKDILAFYNAHLLTGEVDKKTDEPKILQMDFEKLMELFRENAIEQKKFDAR